ncbi:MAG: hypothetical protein SOZ59_10820 [Candidatus Limivivens sp.]|nr:hypothetical protein [Candidatus Limivivens sp.]
MRNRDFFRNPEGKPEYSMSCFWFWNDRIEENEMLRQQALMKEQGVGMPMIHSRFGREIDYLGEEWMGLVKASVTFAMKQGQKVWLYDEDNWPSGTCSKSVTREERYREHFLRMEEVCPEEGEPNASENRESAVSEAESAAEGTEAALNRICRRLAGHAEPRKLLEIWRETPDGKIQILWTASEGMTGQAASGMAGAGRIGAVYWDVRPYEQGGRS